MSDSGSLAVLVLYSSWKRNLPVGLELLQVFFLSLSDSIPLVTQVIDIFQPCFE